MLYNLDKIQFKIASINDYKDNKVDIIKFFSSENIFNNLNINKIYATDIHPAPFINEVSMNRICNLASQKFGKIFDYKCWYDKKEKMPLLSIEEKEFKVDEFKVGSFEDLNKVIELHTQLSTYGKELTERKNQKAQKKQEKVKALQEDVAERKRESRKAFAEQASLARDFNNAKTVSIDFEFRYNKHTNHYMITEVGISTLLNGKDTISEHYLIKENYESKFKRDMQDKFLFGKTHFLNNKDIKDLINKRIEDANFLVFHEKREDFAILKQLNVSDELLSKIDIVDTQDCYKWNFKKKGKFGESLDNLLSEFKIKAEYLHNAGNDAKYTLDLLLKMSEIHKYITNIPPPTSKMKF